MSNFTFHPATKTRSRARIAIIGPSGSGKTFSALAIAAGLGQRVAVIDTERGSASKYAGLPGMPPFDVLELESFSPETYVSAIGAAGAAGYDVLIIDSLSHAWMGKDGALEQVDRAAKRSQSGNSFAAWREVTPKHNALVDAMLASSCHLIVTMRAKTEYVMETNSRGKQEPRKIGLAPIQRDGMEYEFDVVGDITLDHELIISKTRCPEFDGKVIQLPGLVFGQSIAGWLSDGAPVPLSTFNGPGTFSAYVDATDTEPPADPPHSWREDVDAADSPNAVLAIWRLIQADENDPYRHGGASRLAARKFAALLPPTMNYDAIAPVLRTLDSMIAVVKDAACPAKQAADQAATLDALAVASERIDALLPPADADSVGPVTHEELEGDL